MDVMERSAMRSVFRPTGTAVLERTQSEKMALRMPYDYAPDEVYYVEKLTELPPKCLYCGVKRLTDILASVVALPILALPMLVIAVLVKCSSAGPVIYRQERLGLNGKSFQILKFRTMRDHAEDGGAQWCEGDDDERVTKIGKTLRKYHLDELPQLFCTLRGTMSLVGPRPERACFYAAFEEHVHGFSERLRVKPGITGLAQVEGGYSLAPHEKVVLDVEYIKARSLWLDLRILLKTVRIIFSTKVPDESSVSQ